MDGEQAHQVLLLNHHASGNPSSRTIELDGQSYALQWLSHGGSQPGVLRIDLSLAGVTVAGVVVVSEARFQVFDSGRSSILLLHDALAHAADQEPEHAGGLTAPMPGKIIAINCQTGDAVKQGQALLVMEAMKMEHTIYAPGDGIISEVFFVVGEQVADGVTLISMESGGEK